MLLKDNGESVLIGPYTDAGLTVGDGGTPYTGVTSLTFPAGTISHDGNNITYTPTAPDATITIGDGAMTALTDITTINFPIHNVVNDTGGVVHLVNPKCVVSGPSSTTVLAESSTTAIDLMWNGYATQVNGNGPAFLAASPNEGKFGTPAIGLVYSLGCQIKITTNENWDTAAPVTLQLNMNGSVMDACTVEIPAGGGTFFLRVGFTMMINDWWQPYFTVAVGAGGDGVTLNTYLAWFVTQ
jgi:hypothetical protein